MFSFAVSRTRVAITSLAAMGVITSLAVATPTATAAPQSKPNLAAQGRLAADWEAGQLTDGRIYNDQFAFDDWGLTIDVAFSLAAAGGHKDSLDEISAALEANYYDGYVASFGGYYAGAWAKTLLAAKVLGDDWRNFGGRNLRTSVLELVAPPSAGFESGRLRDRDFDYSNTFSQTLGVIGLARTGGTPKSTVTYLLNQQCAAGYFRIEEVVDQTCDQSGSSPDVDATAMAIQALAAARAAGTPGLQPAIAKAAKWLLSAQQADGSFGGGTLTPNPNSNSTGLASIALVVANRGPAAKRAANWNATLQLTKTVVGHGPAKADLGAIAYDPAARDAAVVDGITDGLRDQFRRATAQASLAFYGVPLNTLRAN